MMSRTMAHTLCRTASWRSLLERTVLDSTTPVNVSGREFLGNDFDLPRIARLGTRHQCTDDAQMRHGNHSLTGASLCEVTHERMGTLADFNARFTIPGTNTWLTAFEVQEPIGITTKDLVTGQPRPRPHIELAQSTIEFNLESEMVRNRSGCLMRTLEIARDNARPLAMLIFAERLSQPSGLGESLFSQSRIAMALPSAIRIPGCLPMSNEQESSLNRTHRRGP
jgi:hypothetical protein